ncbi:CHASE2 domain-containing protein [uncultured Oxalicibacterium sp.]|uniref:CHASE2 domain-containing protein n=1 Tax=uncultured Oxalicibacterium sp. TaxID=1168540 RepID=UPI0025EAB50C|nr:CHASE2 domain-containing protein [uncultured Oxalicibacterium sp.]
MILSRFRRKTPLKTEWRIFFLLMLISAGLLGYANGLGQPDRFIYDMLIKGMERPADERVVVIAIDNASIAQLGRWPWNRRIHADLLDILSQSRAKAIGMDIIFSEPDSQTGNDARLADAIRRNGRVILPIFADHTRNGAQATPPLPQLATAAHGVGHTHFIFDADGVVRSILMQETFGQIAWPQFSRAIYLTGLGMPANTALPRDVRERIPFAGPPGHMVKVSYIDVLQGRVPPSFFDDRYVLIGATASGVATMFPTPVTTTQQVMPGVEINANVLAGLLEERGIFEATRWLTALCTIAITCLALFACLYLSPFSALSVTVGLELLLCVGTYALMTMEIWIPPAAAIFMVAAVYPLWSWRRLEATLLYLNDEMARLNRETHIVLRPEPALLTKQDADFLDRQIAAIQIGADRYRHMHQFVSDSLNNMPDATLVLSQSGELLVCNRTAKAYFESLGLSSDQPLSLARIFAHFEAPPRSPLYDRIWYNTLLQTPSGEAVEIETRDHEGREFLIKSTSSRMVDGAMLGWIISLIDVSSLRAAERRREESLNFISHDLRVPQSSILALIQLQKNPATAFEMQEFLSRVEKSVESTLKLAESFVHLAKAESPAYQLQDADFASLLDEAVDNMWAFAHSRSVKIVVDIDVAEHWLHVDRSLVIRALGNLLSNAIKFSPEGATVECRADVIIIDQSPHIACSIADHGPGIALAEQAMIFAPFRRANDHGQDGIGLGLPFVKMVIERHGGRVRVHSIPGKGATFTVLLPCTSEDHNDCPLIEKQEGQKE